jgi:hypothetical protein
MAYLTSSRRQGRPAWRVALVLRGELGRLLFLRELVSRPASEAGPPPRSGDDSNGRCPEPRRPSREEAGGCWGSRITALGSIGFTFIAQVSTVNWSIGRGVSDAAGGLCVALTVVRSSRSSRAIGSVRYVTPNVIAISQTSGLPLPSDGRTPIRVPFRTQSSARLRETDRRRGAPRLAPRDCRRAPPDTASVCSTKPITSTSRSRSSMRGDVFCASDTSVQASTDDRRERLDRVDAMVVNARAGDGRVQSIATIASTISVRGCAIAIVRITSDGDCQRRR